MRTRLAVVSLASLALVVALAPAARVRACCPAFRPGPDTRVKIAEQEILVAWSAATKTEHFVRRASFASEEAGFGFLVPTPTEPRLAEVDAEVFDQLREEIRPRIERRTRNRYVVGSFLLHSARGSAEAQTASLAEGVSRSMPLAKSVDVLQRMRVAGYDAAVLRADDAAALATWLEDNGYDARPELRAWVEPYVQTKWIVTAFKFAGEKGRVGTGSLRMSFQTDRPLFPYRTPTDQRGGGNTLRVFYVGDGRASGGLGEGGAKPWAGQVKYATNAPQRPLADLLGDAVPTADVPAGAWLTAFEDQTWPGGEEDLWFSTDPKGAELIPTVVVWDDVDVMIPVEPFGVLGVVGVLLFVRRRRRAS
ncbi:MAG: DUF2330 domain-containing protein [Planctomycetota bacterium]|nr:DUF2330 domain-containing protein [Planctomycetota bacterium]